MSVHTHEQMEKKETHCLFFSGLKLSMIFSNESENLKLRRENLFMLKIKGTRINSANIWQALPLSLFTFDSLQIQLSCRNEILPVH